MIDTVHGLRTCREIEVWFCLGAVIRCVVRMARLDTSQRNSRTAVRTLL